MRFVTIIVAIAVICSGCATRITPERLLYSGIARGEVSIVDSLLSVGVVTADTRCPKEYSPTALYWAAYSGDPAITQMLIEHGANVNEGSRDSGFVEFMISTPDSAFALTVGGTSRGIEFRGRLVGSQTYDLQDSTYEMLPLSAVATVDTTISFSFIASRPIWAAAGNARDSIPYQQTLELILKNPNCTMDAQTLGSAVRSGDTNLVQYVLDRGVDVNAQFFMQSPFVGCFSRYSAFYLACYMNDLPMAQFLSRKGAKTDFSHVFLVYADVFEERAGIKLGSGFFFFKNLSGSARLHLAKKERFTLLGLARIKGGETPFVFTGKNDGTPLEGFIEE